MRDENGKIIPRDQEAFYLEMMRDKAKKPNQVNGSTGAISKMNAPSSISRAFRGERVPNMMSRRLRQKEQEKEREKEQREQEYEPPKKPEPVPVEHTRALQRAPAGESVEKPLTVKLPDDVKMQLDRMDDEIGTLSQAVKDLIEKSEKAKHQDIDALFRNRCANRRTQGFCKLTAKGKLAKGAQLMPSGHTQQG